MLQLAPPQLTLLLDVVLGATLDVTLCSLVRQDVVVNFRTGYVCFGIFVDDTKLIAQR